MLVYSVPTCFKKRMVCADRIDVCVLAPSASTDGDRIAVGLEEGLYVIEVTRDGEWQG